jgi:ABC-type sugar transport system ATPase subunit
VIEISLGDPAIPDGLAGDVDVTLGIRPEHVEVGPATGGGAIGGTVELVEAVGSDTFLSVVVAPDHTVIVRVPADREIDEGERVGLRFPPEHVRLFDREGRLVSLAPGDPA